MGAADTMKTLSVSDDQVASFSSSGVGGSGGTKNPDMLAPGRSVISLAVPGSFIDQTYGASGAVTGGYLRGSGTSQAAAVVSGAAALVLQQHPTWTNTQVKALLTLTATKLKVGLQTDAAQGKGTLNLTSAFGVTNVAVISCAPGTAHRPETGWIPWPGGPGSGPGGLHPRGRSVRRCHGELVGSCMESSAQVCAHGDPATQEDMFDVGGPVAWSPRRRGQLLVVVGALLGALSGVILGLAVDDPQTPAAVAAPGRAGAAALAAHLPSSQPTTSESTGSGERADGDASTGRQPTEPADRPNNGHGNAGKDGDGRQGKPGKDKPTKDKDK